MAELRLEKISKEFPGKSRVTAVHDISLTVHSGECVALLGPSGAGKSTVLRLIAGLEDASTGTILLDGKPLSAVPPGKRELSMAFQFPALLPQLSVAQNLTLGPKLRGHSDTAQGLHECAQMLGITHLLPRRPETLSGGEQQRVALGRALLAKPRVLLLDEPLAGLDPVARLELRELIRRIQQELRLTTFYVTHDQAEAAAVADRIALLRGGELQQFAAPHDLYLNPSNLFVARFFGPDGLNLLPVRISSEQRNWRAQAGPVHFALPDAPKTMDNLLLGFRPSAVRIRKGNGDWVVKERRTLGWTSILRLVAGQNEITCQFNPNLDSTAQLAAGDSLDLQVEPPHLFLFDQTTGERAL